MKDNTPYRGLRCHVEPDRDRVIVRPVGEIDLATVGVVDAPLGELWDSGFTAIVIDLRWVPFMDSTGLRMLVRWSRRAQEDGVDLRIEVPDDSQVHRLFELTAMLDALPLVTGGGSR
ncbi:MAG TPA: STAS domain-containing protein [Baekduia sp.]|nr:STAS domain-containing protein [Baekduia sp.]